MTDHANWVCLGLYSAFFGVAFTGALVFGNELSPVGELAAKLYVMTTGPLWLVAAYKWEPRYGHMIAADEARRDD